MTIMARRVLVLYAFAGVAAAFAIVGIYRGFFSSSKTPWKTPSPSGETTTRQFAHRIVHLDLKGAPPTMSYLVDLLPFLKRLGATGLLVEYEDMYPYSGDLSLLRRADAYTEAEIKRLVAKANSLHLDLIPLVQTFGHLSFVLKHERFAPLRADPRDVTSLCASNPDSAALAKRLVADVARLHPNAKRIHVGGDEVGGIGRCRTDAGRGGTSALYVAHMKPILEYVTETLAVTPLLWHDMLAQWSIGDLTKFSHLAEPMIWEYRADVRYHVDAATLRRFSATFPRVWAASAFKGADGSYEDFTPIRTRVANHVAWSKILNEYPGPGELIGIALTGWSKYDHFAIPCELLPPALPSLALCLSTLKSGALLASEHERVSRLLGFRDSLVPLDYFDAKKSDFGSLSYPGGPVYNFIFYVDKLRHIGQRCTKLDVTWISPWNQKRNSLNWYRVNQAAECYEK